MESHALVVAARLEQQHAHPGPGEVDGDRAAAGAGAHDHVVELDGVRHGGRQVCGVRATSASAVLTDEIAAAVAAERNGTWRRAPGDDGRGDVGSVDEEREPKRVVPHLLVAQQQVSADDDRPDAEEPERVDRGVVGRQPPGEEPWGQERAGPVHDPDRRERDPGVVAGRPGASHRPPSRGRTGSRRPRARARAPGSGAGGRSASCSRSPSRSRPGCRPRAGSRA